MATSPNTRHLQDFLEKIAPDVRRAFGDIEHSQPAPQKAEQLATALIKALLSQLENTLTKTHHSVYVMPEKAPDTGWMIGVADRRNLTHGRNIGIFACLQENGATTWAGFLDVLENTVAWAAPGEGTHYTKRLRVAGRTHIQDTLLLLPWRTKDIVALELMQKAGNNTIHTRKTGTPVQDALTLAAGKADILINLGLPPAECQTMALFMQEAGAHVSDLSGEKITPESTSLLAANSALHPAALKLFKS